MQEGIQIALLVQKVRQFCCIGGFCLLVELHCWEGSELKAQGTCISCEPFYTVQNG